MSKIITAEQVTGRTGADSTTAEVIATAVNGQIETITSRCWGETKTVTEVYDAAHVLWLRNMDIEAVLAIKVGNPRQPRRAVQAGDYSYNRNGRVVLSYAPMTVLPPSTSDYIEITYSYGVPTEEVPADLTLAALNMAAAHYTSQSQGGAEIIEERMGSRTVKYASATNGGGAATKSSDLQVVNAHAKRRV